MQQNTYYSKNRLLTLASKGLRQLLYIGAICINIKKDKYTDSYGPRERRVLSIGIMTVTKRFELLNTSSRFIVRKLSSFCIHIFTWFNYTQQTRLLLI